MWKTLCLLRAHVLRAKQVLAMWTEEVSSI